MKFLIGCLVMLAAHQASAQQPTGMDRLNAIHCGTKHNPCKPPPPTPIINFNPAAPSLPSSYPVGSQISSIIVTMSDGSPFTGTLGFGSPYSNDTGICALNGTNLILGSALPGASIQNCTITATQ